MSGVVPGSVDRVSDKSQRWSLSPWSFSTGRCISVGDLTRSGWGGMDCGGHSGQDAQFVQRFCSGREHIVQAPEKPG